MKILVLGASGMAGHVISLSFIESGHDVFTFSRNSFKFGNNIIGDLTNIDFLANVIKKGNYDVIINAAGILNKNAELNKSQAVLINSYLPHYLSEITRNLKTKIIHMSTDCVFSGDKGSYNESSLRDGISFYDRTKALGEIENDKDLTFRNSIVGPDLNKNGIGLFNWFMQQGGKINGYTKAIWTGVSTITLAKAMKKAIEENLTGVYHLVNNKKISKHELLKLFNKYLRDEKITILQDDKFQIDKSLINNREDFLFKVPSYEEMVIEIKEWILNHQDLYPHYFYK
jgi:dTDP-4-dehydrorhamnose reductase